MSGGILKTLEGMGLIDLENSPSESPDPSATSTPAITPTSALSLPVTGAATPASVDAGMVAQIKAAVTASSHAPQLANFLAQLETAKQAFPNDLKSAVNAALAFSKLTSSDVRDELSKAVAAALIEAETKIKGQIAQKREAFESELSAKDQGLRAEISGLNDEIKALQSKLGTAQTALSQIDSTRTQKTVAINVDEATALASLAAVKAELTSISNLLP